MTPEAIFREAWRDITSGTARTVAFALLLSAVTAGLVAADLLAVQSMTAAAEKFRSSGASVATIAAKGRIDAAACEALSTVAGVRAAGAIRKNDRGIVAAALPSSSIPVMEATQGFPALLRATDTPGAGVVLSDQVADALRLEAGDTLRTADGATLVTGTYRYPTDGRRPGLGYAALVPVPDQGAFDECWIDVWPASAQTRPLLQTTLLTGSDEGEQPVLSQLNTTLGTEFDGHTAFEERITRHAAALALLLGLGLGYLSVRTRRIHFASALHAGVRRTSLAAIIALEILSWTAPAAILTASTAAVLIATGATDADASALLAAQIAIPAVIGPYLGAAVGLALTRERHLFRYFKDR